MGERYTRATAIGGIMAFGGPRFLSWTTDDGVSIIRLTRGTQGGTRATSLSQAWVKLNSRRMRTASRYPNMPPCWWPPPGTLPANSTVYARNDATGQWDGATLAHDSQARGTEYLAQVRSFGSHRDRVTGISYAFAGHNPRGIFSGVYDPAVPGRIRWSQTPELDLSAVSSAEVGVEKLRVTSFAECNDRLYATVGQQIYERTDGASPQWRQIYANRNPGQSETGLRGLTCAPSPTGQGQVLLAAVEGTAGRIIRIDPRDGSEATDLDLHDFLGKAWGMNVGYTIAAYNNMTRVRDGDLLIGLEAFIPRNSPVAEGHKIFTAGPGHGRLEGDAWYLIRHPNGSYDLHRVPPRPGQPMVSTRSIAASGDAVYFAGFDANFARVHDTGWIVQSTINGATHGSK